MENNNYLTNNKSILIEQALSNRLQLIQKTIEQLTDLIHDRETIKNTVISNLNNEILKANNLILQRRPHNHYQRLSPDPVILDAQREIHSLERTIIHEDINSWRDIIQLKRDLIQSVNELSSVKSRLHLLTNNHSS